MLVAREVDQPADEIALAGATIAPHLSEMVREHGHADAPLFVVEELPTTPDGLLPEAAVAPVAEWLRGLAQSAAARAAVVRQTVDGAGSPDTAIVLRTGSDSEMMSALEREDTLIIAQGPGVRMGDQGPLASAELFVIIDLPKRSTGTSANVPLRGVQATARAVRPGLEIVEVGSAEQLEQALAIRRAVFVLEQGVSLALEIDGHDDAARHLLALRGGAPVGTLRVRWLEGGRVPKIERVAVLPQGRGGGVGHALMGAALALAERGGAKEARLHAQTVAQAFYDRLGFVASGPAFDEDGILHIAMRRPLGAG